MAARLDPENYYGRLPWTTFVGTRQCADTMPVYTSGSTRTYHSDQVFADLHDPRRVARRREGLLGGWLPAVHKVVPIDAERWYDVLVFDYRGWGTSTDIEPDEPGILEDSKAALAWFVQRTGVPEQRIIFYGRSFGCATAIQLAQTVDPKVLILESPFASVEAFKTDSTQLDFPSSYVSNAAAGKYARTVTALVSERRMWQAEQKRSAYRWIGIGSIGRRSFMARSRCWIPSTAAPRIRCASNCRCASRCTCALFGTRPILRTVVL